MDAANVRSVAEVITGAGRFQSSGDAGTHWVEHLRSHHLSVGTYSITARATDDQVPHTEDEVYIVTAGAARFSSSTTDALVSPGGAVFVPAGEVHRFVDVSQDFAAIVLFAPPEQEPEEPAP